MKKLKFDTLQIHGGQHPDSETGSRAVPIYQTTSYVFKDAESAADVFALKKPGHIYTRIDNPTVEVLENRMALLEDGTAAVATSSGSSAITYAILNIAGSGDEIVSSINLYGGTYNLFSTTLPRLGIKTRFVNPDNTDNFAEAINERTKALYVETLGNPTINIADIQAIADIAHRNGIPLIIDNTFATPYLLKPFEFGADIVVYSATKFIGGHGTSIGGVIVESGKFNWANGKFPSFTTPDSSYNGLVYADIKGAPFVSKVRLQLLRDTGACISPFNAFLLLQGLETLSLRMERHVQNAEKVASFLEKHPKVSWVNYPSLADSRYRKLKEKYLPKGAGSIMTFGIKGGVEEGRRFIDSVKIFSLLANVGDAKSLVIHPASTTHGQLSAEELKSAGILPEMIRLSVGIEDSEDLIDDLSQALERV